MTYFNEPKVVKKRLTKLAHHYNDLGTRARDYGMIGEIIFWTLERVLGESYCAVTHSGWTKLYSIILSVMIPIAAASEFHRNECVANAASKLSQIEVDCVIQRPVILKKNSFNSGRSNRTICVMSDDEESEEEEHSDTIGMPYDQ